MLRQEDVAVGEGVLDLGLCTQRFRDPVQAALDPQVLDSLWPASSVERSGVLFYLARADWHVYLVVVTTSGTDGEEAKTACAHPLRHEQRVARRDDALHVDRRVLIYQLPVGLVVHTDLDRFLCAREVHDETANLHLMVTVRRVYLLADCAVLWTVADEGLPGAGWLAMGRFGVHAFLSISTPRQVEDPWGNVLEEAVRCGDSQAQGLRAEHPRVSCQIASSGRAGCRRQPRQSSNDSQSRGTPIDSTVRASEVGNLRSSAASCCAQSEQGSMVGRRHAMTARAL